MSETMQTFNSFSNLATAQTISPLVSDMSTFNVISDDDYTNVQNGLQSILNVFKTSAWREKLSVTQRDDMNMIRDKIKAIVLMVKKWKDEEGTQTNVPNATLDGVLSG